MPQAGPCKHGGTHFKHIIFLGLEEVKVVWADTNLQVVIWHFYLNSRVQSCR